MFRQRKERSTLQACLVSRFVPKKNDTDSEICVGELFKLGWLMVAVAVLHWYSPNHAKFVATVIGVFPETIETSMLIQTHRAYDTCAYLWYPERRQVDPFGPDTRPPCFRLPSPSLGSHQMCCDAWFYINNRRCDLPADECFQSFALAHQ